MGPIKKVDSAIRPTASGAKIQKTSRATKIARDLSHSALSEARKHVKIIKNAAETGKNHAVREGTKLVHESLKQGSQHLKKESGKIINTALTKGLGAASEHAKKLAESGAKNTKKQLSKKVHEIGSGALKAAAQKYAAGEI
jgi:hypothetical protein